MNSLKAAALLLALGSGSAAAQQAGGLVVGGVGMGPGGLQPEVSAAAPLRQTPTDIRSVNPARRHSASNQTAIARIRGDAGYLAGFSKGQPLAISRQPPPEFAMPDFNTFIDAPFIINNFGNAVTIDAGGGEGGEGGDGSGAPTINTQDSTVAINTGPGKIEQNTTSAVNIAAGTGNVAQQVVESSKQ